MRVVVFCFFFFFQAEDGIRDGRVTGVQTCALPILDAARLVWTGRAVEAADIYAGASPREEATARLFAAEQLRAAGRTAESAVQLEQIGRASCRERVEIWGVAGRVEKNTNERMWRRR